MEIVFEITNYFQKAINILDQYQIKKILYLNYLSLENHIFLTNLHVPNYLLQATKALFIKYLINLFLFYNSHSKLMYYFPLTLPMILINLLYFQNL